MGKVTGFSSTSRETPGAGRPLERINDWFEVYQDFPRTKFAPKARAAWIAACPSAIPAAR